MFYLKIMHHFLSWITKINNVLIDNAEDRDVVIPMYKLLEYSDNYSMISGSLWIYHRNKIDDLYDNTSSGKLFKYKTKISGKTSKICITTSPSRKRNCGRGVSEDTFILIYCPNKCKTLKIGDEAVGNCLGALKFICDWLVTRKILQRFFDLCMIMIIYFF